MSRKLKHKGSDTDSLAKSISGEVTRSISYREEKPVDFLHSGCIPINLALSGKGRDGGWARGRVLNCVGDGSTGKTLLALELAAYCYYNIMGTKSHNFPKVKKVRIVYDNVEGVMDFPVKKMYGSKFKKDVCWVRSTSAEKFGRNVAREIIDLKKGHFLLYIVDSLDSLVSEASKERFLDAAESDKDEKGAYKGAEKAAYFSQSFFGNLCNLIEDEKTGVKKDATVFIVSQVRTAIGVTFGKKQYRTGGKGMDFYTHQAAWIRKHKEIERKIKKQERVYGVTCEMKVERSKVAKPFRKSRFDIIFDYGLDNIRSMIRFLYGNPRSFKYNKNRSFNNIEDFILFIEQEGLENDLARRCEERWEKVESDFLRPLEKRKKRF